MNVWFNIDLRNFAKEIRVKAITEKNSCKTTQEFAEHLNIDHWTIVWHLHQSERSKFLDK